MTNKMASNGKQDGVGVGNQANVMASTDQKDIEKERKKAEITGKLKLRDEERVADINKKKEEKASSTVTHERSDYFLKQFNTVRDQLKIDLEAVDQQPTLSKTELTNYFDKLLLELQKMQGFIADSTMFLTAYQIQRSHETVNILRKSIDEKREMLIPKKKFGFKSKKKVVNKPSNGTLDETDSANKINGNSMKILNFEITDCSFADMKGEELFKTSEEVKQKDVALSRLEDCTVKIYGLPGALHINHLKSCRVFCGPVCGSVFIDNCVDCIFHVPCQQMRIHNTQKSDFYIHVTSRAIIEDCKDVRFGPYSWDYEGLEADYKESGLDRDKNSWDDVDDFNWLASDAHSPNWCIIDPADRIIK